MLRATRCRRLKGLLLALWFIQCHQKNWQILHKGCAAWKPILNVSNYALFLRKVHGFSLVFLMAKEGSIFLGSSLVEYQVL